MLHATVHATVVGLGDKMETTNVESIERQVTIPLSVDLMKEVFMNREKIKYKSRTIT
jgi:hypothetical protein